MHLSTVGSVATGGLDGKWDGSGIRSDEGGEEIISNNCSPILKPERENKEESCHSLSVVGVP